MLKKIQFSKNPNLKKLEKIEYRKTPRTYEVLKVRKSEKVQNKGKG